MLLAVDPSSLFFRSQQQSQMGMMGRPNPNTSSDFQRFFSSWGIEYSAGDAIADPNIAYTQQGSMQPAWLIFREDNMSQDFLPAAELNAVLLLEPGSISLEGESELTFEPILETTDSAGTVNGMMLQFAQQGALLNQLQTDGQSKTVAGVLSGEFTTAFPNGKPSSPADAAADEDESSEDQDSSNCIQRKQCIHNCRYRLGSDQFHPSPKFPWNDDHTDHQRQSGYGHEYRRVPRRKPRPDRNSQ